MALTTVLVKDLELGDVVLIISPCGRTGVLTVQGAVTQLTSWDEVSVNDEYTMEIDAETDLIVLVAKATA